MGQDHVNTVGFGVLVSYTLECSECQRREYLPEYVWGSGQVLKLPGVPAGWSVLNGQLICELHLIEVSRAL